MPLMRYFLFVGGALLALLFVANAALPPLPATARTETAAADFPAIRIHSDRKWPDRIVFDTSITARLPAMATNTAVSDPPVATAVADLSAEARVRETFAQFQPDPTKPDATMPQKRKLAKRHVAPMRIAQQPQSGFFGRSIW